MRTKFPDKVERGRETTGKYASKPGADYGRFYVMGPCDAVLCIFVGGETWEHVSVSTQRRCPNWIEMSAVKDWFWNDDECVAQFHPPKSEYINNHPYTLHLWRHPQHPFELPPSILVGVQSAGMLDEKQASDLRKQYHLE